MSKNTNKTYNYAEYEQLLLSELIDIADSFDEDWFFRGQANHAWGIHTSQERSLREHWKINERKDDGFVRSLLEENETTILKKIKSSVSYIPSDQRPNDDFSWLALLQHHGCKTRLVDFTRSFYIALFFAVSDNLNDDAAIWAINASMMKSKAEEKNATLDYPCCEEKFRRKLIEATVSWNGIIPSELGVTYAEPEHLNERLIAQQGLFLCPLDFHKSFHSHPIASQRESWILQSSGG